MSLREIADRLVEANKTGDITALLENDYAPHAVSVEAFAMDPTQGAAAEGLDAIRAKHAWWEASMEVHSAGVEGPFLHGDNSFACIFTADMTDKATGKRSDMKEVAVYTVENGKIVREEFYYTM